MKKHVITIICGLMSCAMLFASCTKKDNIQTTTSGSEPAYSENTSLETLPSEVDSTLAGTQPATSKTSKAPSTTKKKAPSTTMKKSSGQKKQPVVKDEDKKPASPPATGNTDDEKYRKLPVKFDGLNELKKIAKANKNTAGCDLFKDGKIIAPTFLEANEMYGEVDKESIDFYISFYMGNDTSKSYDIDYSVNLKKSTSHNMEDYAGKDFVENCYKVNYQGTLYYMAVMQEEGQANPDVIVFSFCGDYCTLAIFYEPPLDSMGQMDFAELAQFSSITI